MTPARDTKQGICLRLEAKRRRRRRHRRRRHHRRRHRHRHRHRRPRRRRPLAVLIHIAILTPLKPSLLEFIYVSAELSAAAFTLTLTFIAKLVIHAVDALVVAFTWPRLTFVTCVVLYVA